MGYCMEMTVSKFHIAADKVEPALQAIKDLMGTLEPDRCFEWVTTGNVLEAPTFAKAMQAWRWWVELDGNSDVIGIEFYGEKYGDEIKLFTAIAPFVTSGSCIEMEGEDGSVWRWFFNDGEVKEQNGEVTTTWPEE